MAGHAWSKREQNGWEEAYTRKGSARNAEWRLEGSEGNRDVVDVEIRTNLVEWHHAGAVGLRGRVDGSLHRH
jgi:hypothetical protein